MNVQGLVKVLSRSVARGSMHDRYMHDSSRSDRDSIHGEVLGVRDSFIHGTALIRGIRLMGRCWVCGQPCLRGFDLLMGIQSNRRCWVYGQLDGRAGGVVQCPGDRDRRLRRREGGDCEGGAY